MSGLERFQTLIILTAVLIGLALGQWQWIQEYAEFLIMPCLFLLFYGMFLTVSVGNLRESFVNMRFVGTNVVLNFIWTPVLAWLLGWVFLADHPYLWLGFFMLMVTPCTDWYVIFTGIAKGNVNQSMAILPINLVLQLLLLPVYLYIFTGVTGSFDYGEIIKSIWYVLMLPLLSAFLTSKIFVTLNKQRIMEDHLMPFFNQSNILFLSLAIVAMFASQGYYLLEHIETLGLLAIPVLLFFLINFFMGEGVGKVMNFSRADTVSLDFTILARNSPVALAIAVMAFPDQPLVALALIIGPLLELPILAVVAKILLMRK